MLPSGRMLQSPPPERELTRIFDSDEVYKLSRLGIDSIKDLLCYVPMRYEDRRRIHAIGELQDGVKHQRVVGQVISTRGGKVLEVILDDGSDARLPCVFFHYRPYHLHALKPGTRVCVQGKPEFDTYRQTLVMRQPEILKSNEYDCILPIYRKMRGVSRDFLTGSIRRALDAVDLNTLFLEPPAEHQKAHALLSVERALREIHQPTDLERLNQALHSMKVVEIYDRIGQLLTARAQRTRQPGVVVEVSGADVARMAQRLPYEMNDSQKTAIEAVRQALASPAPARMLLIGGVGAGKSTICHLAARACVYGARDGRNKALILAPTKVLARQLYTGIQSLFGQDIAIHLALHNNAEVPDADVYVGTSGILAKRLQWRRVGLVVIDEEHRWGKELKSSQIPDDANLLLMTATPLPQTIAMYLYGHMDVIFVRGTPRDRQVSTQVLTRQQGNTAMQAVRRAIESGRKAIVVYEAMAHASTNETLPLGESCLFLSPRFGGNEAVYLDKGLPDIGEFRKTLASDPDLVFEPRVKLTRINAAFNPRKLVSDPDKLRAAFPMYAYDAANKNRVSLLEAADVLVRGRNLKRTEELLEEMRNGFYAFLPLVRESQINRGLDIATALPSWEKRYPGQVGYIHGKMRDREQESVLEAYTRGEKPLLISTTVVEVGIDIEGTDVIVLANAAKLGVAQIVQLRGRVGRHGHPGECFLICSGDEDELERLRYIAQERDDFKLAERDLIERGWGALDGIDQSGKGFDHFFKVAEDYPLLNTIRELWSVDSAVI